MDGFVHPAVSMARGLLTQGLRTTAMLPLALLLGGFVVYAGAVLQARPGSSASAGSSHVLSSSTDRSVAPATQPAPIVVVPARPNQDAVVFIAGSPEQAEAWEQRIASASLVAEAKGLRPVDDRVVFVLTPADEAVLLDGIRLENQLRHAYNLPPLRVVDLRNK